MNISLLVPTKDRPSYVKRLLKYYSDLNFKGYIYILDGSNTKLSKNITNYIKQLNNKKIIYFHDVGYPGMITKKYLSKVNTDYVAQLGDDDYLIPDGLKKCIKFLDKNPNFSAAHGEGIIVTSSENPNKINHIDLYAQTVRLENSAKERVFKHLSDNTQPNFSVFRKKVFEKILSPIPNFEDSALCPNRGISDYLIQTTMSVVCTKIKEISSLYLVRQITSVEFEYPHTRKGKDFDKSIEYFIEKISEAICDNESLDYNYVKAYVKKGLDNYLNPKAKKILKSNTNLSNLHKNPKHRFFNPFLIVYNSIIGGIKLKTRVADYIANFLKEKGVKDIFMLTGYGAMYMNDAIKLNGINYYATRNEATAPIMASAYAKSTNKIGVACVTAGPGATNAIPGLAEAYVDSSPIIVFSGQVDFKHTTFSTKSKSIRTFGTAEINILPIVRPLTKYCEIVKNPNEIRYILEKAYYYALEGRPGPVWLDVPLNVQQKEINFKKLKKFKPEVNKRKIKNKKTVKQIQKIISLLQKFKKPLIVAGNGVKQSGKTKLLYKIIKLLKIPVIMSRFAQDIYSHDKEYVMGQAGIKGTRYCKKIMSSSDLVISLGCRLAPQFVGHDFEVFKNSYLISVDIEKDELTKKGCKINLPINEDLKFFLPIFYKFLKKTKLNNFNKWSAECKNLKMSNPMINNSYKRNPIDLYYFMNKIGEVSNKKNILVTDAGSNYYIGGQVWKFKKGQKELTSGSNAAMGLTIPLSIGAAVSSPNYQILAVTGDGSLELNIQELKTISQYKLNIKLFVINNGGYVSMHNWQDTFFEGRRVDTSKDTGEGTLNLRNIAEAFELDYYKIDNYKSIGKDLKKIMQNDKPLFVEVLTDNKQKIYDSFKDY